MSGRELPEGWVEAPLGEVTLAKVAQREPDTHFRYIDIGSVDRVAKAITQAEELPASDAPSRARQVVEPGDVLVSTVRPNLNAVAQVPDELRGAIASTGFAILRSVGPDPRWIYAFVRTPEFVDAMTDLVQGALYPAIRGDDVRSTVLPLPPLAEQGRIVEKLDKLRGHSRRAREALDEVPKLLEQLKQSVLAAAFRGDLTAEWRANNPDVEPASVLLERIRPERRRQGGSGYFGDALSELPDGWAWTTLGDAFDVRVGATPSRAEPSFWGGSIPWVSSGEVAFCRIHSTRECITDVGLEKSSTRLQPPGTVLIGMIGEGRTRGQVAILDVHACNNQNSAAIRVSDTPIVPEYVYRYLEAQYVRSRTLGSGNNQPALNKSRVQAMWLPVAPLREQVEICRVVEGFMAAWSAIQAEVDGVASDLTSLDQSLLAKAFRGELVPQDPNDEPASALLARIRAEREAAGPSPRKRRA